MSISHIQNVSGGPGIVCYVTSVGTNYFPNDSIPNDGALRTYAGNIQYYDADSHCWMLMQGSDVSVDLAADHQVIMDWVRDKMVEDVRIKDLTEKYPALKKAKENFDVIKALVENDN
jgi:hypothetical protein